MVVGVVKMAHKSSLKGRIAMNTFKILVMSLAFSAVITACAFRAPSTIASIPAELASYDKVFDAATQLVTTAGYTVTRADRGSGTITGTKTISGDALNFNILLKRVSDTGIGVTLVREGGGVPLPTAVWKTDAKQMLQSLAQLINVPESKVMVTFGEETKALNQL